MGPYIHHSHVKSSKLISLHIANDKISCFLIIAVFFTIFLIFVGRIYSKKSDTWIGLSLTLKIKGITIIHHSYFTYFFCSDSLDFFCITPHITPQKPIKMEMTIFHKMVFEMTISLIRSTSPYRESTFRDCNQIASYRGGLYGRFLYRFHHFSYIFYWFDVDEFCSIFFHSWKTVEVLCQMLSCFHHTFSLFWFRSSPWASLFWVSLRVLVHSFLEENKDYRNSLSRP